MRSLRGGWQRQRQKETHIDRETDRTKDRQTETQEQRETEGGERLTDKDRDTDI